jgi:outer membrane protein OmpA-like peptidoglycan-associated protein
MKQSISEYRGLESRRLRYAFAVASALSSGLASAADRHQLNVASDEVARSYLSASGGRAWANDRDRARDGAGLKLAVGRALGEHWNAELSASYVDFEAGSDDAKRAALGIETVYAFNSHDWTPLLLAGVGVVRYETMSDRGRSVVFTASGGFGLLTPPLNHRELRIRTEVRYVYDAVQSHEQQVHAYFGVSLPLRGRKRSAVPSKGDNGVVEPRSAQTHSVSGNFVTALPAQVEITHPGSAEPKRTTNEDRQTVVAEVNFAFDSTRLSEASHALLIQAAQTLRERNANMIEVGGHTDHVGSDAYNLDLSTRRAQGVAEMLVELGLERSQLVVVGYGESRPVADNSKSEGRAKNRRVEVRMLPR